MSIKKFVAIVAVLVIVACSSISAFAEDEGKNWVPISYFNSELYQFGIDEAEVNLLYKLDPFSRPQFWLVVNTDINTFRILLEKDNFVFFEDGIWFEFDFANQTSNELLDTYWQLREEGTI